MTATVFVDTNIFVYSRDSGEPEKQPVALEWLQRLWTEQRGRTSMQVLSEYYTTVTRKLTPGLAADDAWEDVEALLAWEPQVIDGGVLAAARSIEQRYRLSWWDSMIVAAADIQGCEMLLSEDLQHRQTFGVVTVWNPFDAGVAEQPPPFIGGSKPRSRHRTPGRPRRSAAAK